MKAQAGEATSIKVRVSDKRRLHRLQAELTVQRGRKISQQDLFAELLNLAEREKDRLGGWTPLSKAERKRVMALPLRGRRTGSEGSIDEDVYGEIV